MSKIHADETHIDDALVGQLVADQFPQWAELPLRRIKSPGTSNAIYRLGDDLYARLPLTPGAAAKVDREYVWIPKLESLVSTPIPTPLAKGNPGSGYPFDWTICKWLAGSNPVEGQLENPQALAKDLAAFVKELRAIKLPNGPQGGRGRHPKVQDEWTRTAIKELEGKIDTDAALREWEKVVKIPEWDGKPVWIHGDLMPGNLLVEGGRLSAVLDFGCLNVGDPAADMIPAWNMLPADARDTYRQAVGVDDATWARGKGWALTMALLQLPYYEHSHPAMAANARFTINAVLSV